MLIEFSTSEFKMRAIGKIAADAPRRGSAQACRAAMVRVWIGGIQ
jgi:hypothetical protein